LVWVVGVVVVLLLLWPLVQRAREAAWRANCVGELKIMGLAMQTYHDVHGCLPPAYFADKEGRPAHSWRVVLLPAYELTALYEKYRFDEAWSSPHNRAMADGLPIGMSGIVPMYHCPTDRDSDWLDTCYVLVVGPETASPGPTSLRLKDFVDGMSHTIVVAEMSESGIHWMEPRDLNFEDMSFRVNDPRNNCIRSRHPGVANAMFADGTVRSLSEDIDPELLKGLLTPAGGEDTSAFFEEYCQ
jgi:prepilin-type processing-associated H-X9-DG protein